MSWIDAAEFTAKLSQQEKLKPYYSLAGETATIEHQMSRKREGAWPALQRLTRLSRLDIHGICTESFSDEVFEHLALIPKLKGLGIIVPPERRNYSPQGIEKFRKLRPDVDLYVDGTSYPAAP